MTTKDGGNAFPSGFPSDQGGGDQGMSLRDWFAGKVIQGMVANPSYFETSYETMTTDAYKVADLMLAARERKEGP